jgi:glycosyltransferase involved in cell wall biosynthesis
MVINCGMQKPVAVDLGRFPDAQVVNGFIPTEQDCRRLLQDVDVVASCETFYRPGFADLARSMGVKTVLAPNFEFLDCNDQPTLWALPSLWHYDDVPFDNKTFLPVPIDTDRFTPNTASTARRFLHVVGRPAVHDRNGTADLLRALQHVQSDIELTLTCQEPGYINSLVRERNVRTPDNVTLIVKPGDVADNADLYAGQDVLVLPRRFGGLCLPVNEALGSGMPVIMPYIDPNWWLPGEWLISAEKTTSFRAKQRIDVYAVDPMVLARKIDRFAQDDEFFQKAQRQALELRDQYSWTALKPTYIKTFEEL